jgi:hypothetical protein
MLYDTGAQGSSKVFSTDSYPAIRKVTMADGLLSGTKQEDVLVFSGIRRRQTRLASVDGEILYAVAFDKTI